MQFFPLFVLAAILLLASIRQINQYERGVRFTLGRFTSIAHPGWRLVIPVFQFMKKVDICTKAVTPTKRRSRATT